MSFSYGIIGAGRQGIAAGYDLAKFGSPEKIIFADQDINAAREAADAAERLTGKSIFEYVRIHAGNDNDLEEFAEGLDGIISAVPYYYNYQITKASIKHGVHMADFGGNTGTVQKQLMLSDQAELKKISIIPDCGMDPGLNISMIAYTMQQLDKTEEIRSYGAGLPKYPRPPWNYNLNFNVNGLTNEYYGNSIFIRDGKVTEVPALEETEVLEFPEPLGKLEAAVTAGGLSMLPWTLEGKVKVLENKTLRYPGHWDCFRAFRDLGLFDTTKVQFMNREISPRDFYHFLVEPKITGEDTADICILKLFVTGEKNGKKVTRTMEIIDGFNDLTGLTGMQRLTGFHASLMLIEAVHGNAEPGVVTVDMAVPGATVIEQIKKRGIEVKEEEMEL